MNFVIDLDSTLIQCPVLERACSDCGSPGMYTMESARDWCFTTIREDIRNRAYQLFSDPEFMCNLPLNEGAQDLVRIIQSKGHNVWIATCRDENLHEQSHKQIQSLFPGVTSVTLPASKSKQGLYLKLKADVVIDDSPANIAAAIMAGVPHIYMYSSPSTPYNWRLWSSFGCDMETLIGIAELDEWRS